MSQSMSKCLSWSLRLGSAVTAAVALPVTAAAQSRDPHYDEAKSYGAVSVRDRDRSAFRPDGLRIGNFIVIPEAGYNLTYNDNIYGTMRHKSADLRHELSTGVHVQSDLPRHMLEFMAQGRAVTLQDHTEMRYADGNARLRFRIDIDHAHKIFGSAKSELTHEEHVEVETPSTAKKPVPLLRNHIEAGLTRDAGKLAVSLGGRYESWNFRDVDAIDGSLLDQDFRDISRTGPFMRLAYRPSPGYAWVGEAKGIWQTSRGDGIVDHNGRGYELRAGVEMEMSPLVKFALMGGVHSMDFDHAGFDRITKAVWEARAQWLVLPVLTLEAKTKRSVEPTSSPDASARVNTSFIAGAQYEAWRNLILTAEAEYRIDEFHQSTREDDTWFARLGAEYYHTKNWLFTFNYEYRQRESVTLREPVTQNKVMFGVKYRY